MAATTANVRERADKITGGLHGKNLEEAVKNLEKQFSTINSNLKKDPTTGNVVASTTTSTTNVKTIDNVKLSTLSLSNQNSPIPLTSFGVLAYGDIRGYYYEPGGTVSKSKLPLDFVTDQLGNGNILSVKIDGVATTSYRIAKSVAVATNIYNIVTEWQDDLVFNNTAISNLSNGIHTVEVTCSSKNKYTTGGADITDNFSFDLEN